MSQGRALRVLINRAVLGSAAGLLVGWVVIVWYPFNLCECVYVDYCKTSLTLSQSSITYGILVPFLVV